MHRLTMHLSVGLLAAVTCVVFSGPARAQTIGPWEQIRPDLSNIRGVNYVPDYVTPLREGSSLFKGVIGPHAQWFFYDRNEIDGVGREVDDQLRRLKLMGVNAVRVWLSAYEYYRDPQQGPNNTFIQKFEHFLSLCEKNRLYVMPVVWDNFGSPPDFGDPERNIQIWTRCPGYTLVPELAKIDVFATVALPYVRDIADASSRHPRVVFCWDIWNEPPVSSSPLGRAHRDMILWTAVVLSIVDPGRHITVGMAGWTASAEATSLAQSPLITVLSGHPHAHFMEAYVHHVNLAAQRVSEPGPLLLKKPFLANEVGGSGVGADYGDVIDYCKNVSLPPNEFEDEFGQPKTKGIGFLLFQGMIGVRDDSRGFQSRHLFSQYTGMHYIDGEVRDRNACLAFRAAAIRQGVSPANLWTPEQIVQKSTSDPLYIPQADLPVDADDFEYWKAAISVETYNDPDRYLGPDGGLTLEAFRAGRLFHWVMLQSFGIHVTCFDLSASLLQELNTEWALYDTGNLEPKAKLEVLERWRAAMQLADEHVTGPR